MKCIFEELSQLTDTYEKILDSIRHEILIVDVTEENIEALAKTRVKINRKYKEILAFNVSIEINRQCHTCDYHNCKYR